MPRRSGPDRRHVLLDHRMIGRVFLNLYQITAPLGQGSMGKIYLARHRTSGREVVLKVMHEQVARNKQARECFEREMECMRRFKHPCAVTLLDASLRDPNGACMVLEYVRGSDFQRLLEHYKRFALARIGRLIGQLCDVLRAAHGQGIIHRDLKPGNLMVADWGKPLERLKVMDFGLAKLAELPDIQPDKYINPMTVVVTGTAEYLCPEQVRNIPLDHRADLYSLGVMLFELLTGKLPFQYPKLSQILMAHIKEAPPTFAAVGATGIAPEIEAVVQACLAKEPAQRPGCAWEVGERLEKALGQKILDVAGEAPPPSAVPTAPVRPAPTRTTQMVTSRPQRTTELHAAPAAPTPKAADTMAESAEAVFRLEAPAQDAAALSRLDGQVVRMGGKVMERNASMVRALLGATPQRAMTEVELRVVNSQAPRQQLIYVTMRPLGTLALALSANWKASCDRIHADLRASLAGAGVR